MITLFILIVYLMNFNVKKQILINKFELVINLFYYFILVCD